MTQSNRTADVRSSEAIVEAMADRLFEAAIRDEVDLGDERSVDRRLAQTGFRAGDILGLGDVALDQARARVQRRAAIRDLAGKSADVASLALLIAVWAVTYCLVCPPAKAAEIASGTDLLLFDLATMAPIVAAAVLLIAWFWRDRTMRLAEPAAEPELFEGPPTAPTIEQVLRKADGT